ncbi:hypothetical protein E2C01_017987 [Portunus trituberculatus]|uniref:Uncharacterized protein n=1 Tax=Portunus trituberculatus TaxID=210409 RepID=A0A5B7DVA5_PORTR|nr:hypothetical protein [Portunus trituberculatus]
MTNLVITGVELGNDCRTRVGNPGRTPQGTATSVTRCTLDEEDVLLQGLSPTKGVASLVSGEGRLERKTLHALARHRTDCHITAHTILGTARTVTRVTEAP